jgi:magnesium-transporting ATPase (P-type)
MITNRDERLDEIYAEIETGLKLVGSSAIEDRLQDAVAQTLQSLKSVGIKVWVLTGDKVETAINIGYSAGLLEKNMLIRVIEQSDLDEIKERMKQVMEDFNKIDDFNCSTTALIVTGESLGVIQGDETVLHEFLTLSDISEVVIACRVTP